MYDKNKDYQAEIDKSVSGGNFTAAAEWEKARNEKIDGEGLNMQKTYKYTQNPAAVIPQSYSGKQSLSNDYMQQGMDAYRQGNYNAYGAFTDMHNQKSRETGISQPVFNPLLYDDVNAQARQDARGAIADYGKKGFSYDPNSDIQYQTVKKIKEDEANTAGRNMIAQLAAQNGGVLPADMAGLVAGTQQSIINQADAQIPELYRLAYEKWADGRSDLYNQYGLLGSESEFGRGSWQMGSQNFQNNTDREREDRKWDSQFKRANLENDRDYDRSVLESDRNYDRAVYQDDRDYDRSVLESDRNYNRAVYQDDRDYDRGVLESDRDYKLNEAQVYNSYLGTYMNNGKYYNPGAATGYANAAWNKIYGGAPDYAAEALSGQSGAAGGGEAKSSKKTSKKGGGNKSAAALPKSTEPQKKEPEKIPEKIHVDGIGYLTPKQAEAAGVVAYIDGNGQTRYRKG